MSFLDKIKGKKGRDSNSLDSDSAGMPLDDVMVLDRPAFEGAANAPSVEGMGRAAHMDSSIITEAAPSEIADFSETRLPAADGADGPSDQRASHAWVRRSPARLRCGAR
jgi:twitching motility protein PilJ